MRWLQNILFLACLVALGCQSTGKKPPAQKTSQNQNGSAPFYADDRQTKGNSASPIAIDGMLAGSVKDSVTGLLLPNAVINVTPVGAGPSVKPIGIQADDQGYFMIKGLRSGATYMLSASAQDGSRTLAGGAITDATNTKMVILVKEGNATSTTPPPMPNPAATSPIAPEKNGKAKLVDPAGTNIPAPDPAPKKDPLTEGQDQSWSPGKVPPAARPIAPPAPTNPNIADMFSKTPPVTNIPSIGIPEARTEPPPPPAPAPMMSAVPANSSPIAVAAIVAQPPPERRASFTVYDLGGDPVEFQKLTDRRLIVLDFWKSDCGPCLRKIPALIGVQSNYSEYVTVVGINCDELPWAQRKAAVEKIQEDFRRRQLRPFNYRNYLEGDGQEGRVQQQFNVRAYPWMVLLDHSGRKLWEGTEPLQLENAIKYYCQRRQ